MTEANKEREKREREREREGERGKSRLKQIERRTLPNGGSN